MTRRVQAEVERLYPDDDAPPGHARALVMEAVQPAGWEALSRVWQGVQADLDLPAPAIAVSGTDALQLWFSSEPPLDVARAHAFLRGLQSRYLADLPPSRLRLWPDPAQPARRVQRVPARQAGDVWSAFVSPDLAAVFSDTPWLDIEPGDDGQAALLRGLQPMKAAPFEAALAQLGPAVAPVTAEGSAAAAALPAAAHADDPRGFLLRVMNDERVDMALRIEAAKALL